MIGKKFVTALCISALVLSIPAGAVGSTQAKSGADLDTVVIAMDTVETIMLENSMEMKQIKANLDIVQGNYDKMLHDMDKLQDKIKVSEMAVGASLTTSYDTMEDSRDKIKSTLDVTKATYERQVKQQVLTAQKQLMTYFSNIETQKMLDLQMQIQKTAVTDNYGKLENGFLSKKDYNNSVLSLKKTEAQAASTKSACEIGLRDLLTKLGVAENEKIKLVPPDIQAMDFAFIKNLDFDADLTETLEKSSAIRAAKLTYDNALKGDYAEDWDIASYKLDWDLKKQQVKNGFRQQYDALIVGYDDLMADRDAIEKQRSDFSDEADKVKYGFSTQKRADSLKLQLLSAESSLTIKENTLYAAYLNYLLTKNGN